MRKKLKKIGLVVVGLLVLVAAVAWWLYCAARRVPDFYQQAVSEQSQQRADGQELEARATALFSDLRHQGDWRALLTAKQINGWLAVDLVEKYPHLLPPTVSDPRVAIQQGMLLIGVRAEQHGVETVLSVETEIYLSEPNVVACRIRRARAGSLALPRKQVLDEITRAALRADVPLRWAQLDGDPVALLTIDLINDENGHAVSLEKIELHEGELYLAGVTRDVEPDEKQLGGQ